MATGAAGLVILVPPTASLQMREITITLQTLGGASAAVIGTVLLACAAGMLFQPTVRVVAGWTTLILALAAFVAANLGSMLIGTTLGIVGAAFALSWKAPTPEGDHASNAAARDHGSAANTEADAAATDPHLTPVAAATGNVRP